MASLMNKMKLLGMLCLLVLPLTSGTANDSGEFPTEFDPLATNDLQYFSSDLKYVVATVNTTVKHTGAVKSQGYRRFSSRILYYDNATASFQILLTSGDIELNPGPSPSETNGDAPKKRTAKNPCATCGKGVTSRSKAISCDHCTNWTHCRCSGIMTIAEYDCHVQEGSSFSYTCDECSILSLPFADIECDQEFSSAPDSEDLTWAYMTHPIPEIDYSCFRNKGLHFTHLNIRSLLPKLSELKTIILNTNVAVLSFSETWLDNTITDSEIEIQGYSIIRKDRDRGGGGVCMYIRNDIAFNIRNDLEIEGLEAIWADILLPKTKPFLIGCIYRPPKQKDFIHLLDSVLSLCHNQETYLLGDTNFNVMDNSNSKTKRFVHTCNSFGFNQLITEITRVGRSSSGIITSTLIDHILCNDLLKVSQSGVLPIGLSDHFLVFCTRKAAKSVFSTHNTVNIRSMKNYNVETYTNLLETTDWSDVLNNNCVDSAWSNFRSSMDVIMDQVAPRKTVRIKQRTEPWMTSTILDKIKTRDQISRSFKKGDANVSFSEYASFRNSIQREVKKAKSNYFKTQLDENMSNPKALWKNLSSLGYSTRSKSKAKIILNVDGKIESETFAVGQVT